MTEAFTVIAELQKGMAAITDADIQRVQRNLGATGDNEKALGTVHNLEARKLWAVAQSFEAQTLRFVLDAKFTANSEEEAAEAVSKALRARTLEAVVREIFWTQVKEDIGGDAWVSAGGIGLRAGWLVVACPKSPVRSALDQILGTD